MSRKILLTILVTGEWAGDRAMNWSRYRSTPALTSPWPRHVLDWAPVRVWRRKILTHAQRRNFNRFPVLVLPRCLDLHASMSMTPSGTLCHCKYLLLTYCWTVVPLFKHIFMHHQSLRNVEIGKSVSKSLCWFSKSHTKFESKISLSSLLFNCLLDFVHKG